MALALSADLRCRVVAAVENGMSARAAATRFSVAPSTAIKWLQQWRRTGSVQPQAPLCSQFQGDKRSHRPESRATEVLALIDETPDITLAQIVAHLQQRHDLTVAPSTVWRLLDRHGLSFKKKAHAAEQQRPDVWQRRLAWFEAQPELEPERLGFIDETGASTKPRGAAGTPRPRRDGQALRPGRQGSTVPGVCPALQGLLALFLSGIG